MLEEKESNGVLSAVAVGATGSGLAALGLASLMEDEEGDYINRPTPMEAMATVNTSSCSTRLGRRSASTG